VGGPEVAAAVGSRSDLPILKFDWLVRFKTGEYSTSNEILYHPAKGDKMNEIVILNPDMESGQ
jgi:hypothetical protein